MSDSTLHIGTLASNNVNNIVNDTSKYDEYKEKVKELEKELQTRKDTFEKMTEPLVYVCDCYQKFNVVTGMPKSTFGDSFGYAMQKEISDYMQDFYAGKVSREDLDSYFFSCQFLMSSVADLFKPDLQHFLLQIPAVLSAHELLSSVPESSLH